MVTRDTFFCILILFTSTVFHSAEADLVSKAMPTKITLGITDVLDVNCSLSVVDTNDLVAMVSFSLSRANDSGHSFTELAIISEYSPMTVNLMTTEDVLSAGVLDQDGESYLHLSWEHPTASQGGVYQCTAVGLNSVGHVVVSTGSVQVVVDEANLQDYVNKIEEMRNYSESCEQRVSPLENFVSLYSDTCISTYLESSYLSYKGHNYYLSKVPFSDIDISLFTCKGCGGYLVEVDNADEHQAIRAFFTNRTDLVNVYIAGSDSATEGVWVLQSTGQPLPYVDWQSGAPRNGASFDCLRFYPGGNWVMNDYHCQFSSPDSDVRYMCEIPKY